jgi:hypothetical protein
MNNAFKGHVVAWPFLTICNLSSRSAPCLKQMQDWIEVVYEKGFDLLQFAAG